MQIPHVFIDTSIFIGQNYDYKSAAFRQLISLAEADKLLVYVTRVTVNEVEFHIAEDVVKAKSAFEGFRVKADVRILKNVTGAPTYGVFNGFDESQAKEVLLCQFRAFLHQARVNVLEITDVPVDEVFQRYFSRTPPFGDKKKHEFPDAFSLAAIEQWCKESTGRMYVVSSDPDWFEACSLNPSLRSVQSLSEFLDLLSRGERLAELVNKLFEQHQEPILEKIKEGIDPLNLIFEPYGELQSAYVDSARIVKQYLIEVDKGKAIFDVVSEVSYSADVLYRNALMATGFWRREDTEYGSTNVRAEVTIAFEEENSSEVLVESANVKHDNFHVFPDEDPEDFARKFTKAQKGLAEHVVVIADRLGGVKWVLAKSPEAIIKRFDEIMESLPVRLMLDLKTLNMLNSLTGGLNYHGATTIKDRTGRRTVDRSSDWSSPFAPQMSATSRRVFEAARMFEPPGVRQAMEHAKLFNQSAIHRAIDDTKLFNQSAIHRALEDAKFLNHSSVQQALEAARHIFRSPLSGHSFSRNMLLDIEPKRADPLPNDETSSIRVKVLRNADVYGPSEGGIEENNDENSIQTATFEFNGIPLSITLKHNVGSRKPTTTEHKLRRPTTERWIEWASELERSIRYLSDEEVAAELEDKNDIESDSNVSIQSYSEWTANERLYDDVVLEVAEFKLGYGDEGKVEWLRSFAPDRIKDLLFEIKSSVIRKLYGCYCELDRKQPSNSERSIVQYLDIDSTSFQVRHILRQPNEEESRQFRLSVVNGSFSTDEEDREIINLQLKLATAVTLYDRLLIRIENGTVDGNPYDESTRESFLQAINPVYKLRVLEPLCDVNAWYFAIDDFTIP